MVGHGYDDDDDGGDYDESITLLTLAVASLPIHLSSLNSRSLIQPEHPKQVSRAKPQIGGETRNKDK